MRGMRSDIRWQYINAMPSVRQDETGREKMDTATILLSAAAFGFLWIITALCWLREPKKYPKLEDSDDKDWYDF
jgi:hypothetical protein